MSIPDIGLTNLEIVRYGNLVGVDWEGISINDIARRIQAEGLTAKQVRAKLDEDVAKFAKKVAEDVERAFKGIAGAKR